MVQNVYIIKLSVLHINILTEAIKHVTFLEKGKIISLSYKATTSRYKLSFPVNQKYKTSLRDQTIEVDPAD